MPLGLAKSVYQGFSAVAAGRDAVTSTVYGDAQVDTAQYKFGSSSMLLDGVDDGIITDDALELSNGEWTMECWARFSSFASVAPVVFDPRVSGGSLARIIGLRLVSGNYRIGYWLGTWYPGSTNLSTNTWTHLAWVYDGSDVKAYVDGTLDLTKSDTGTFVDGRVAFGALKDMVNYEIAGHFDEIRISRIARYTSNFTPSTSALTNDSDTCL